MELKRIFGVLDLFRIRRKAFNYLLPCNAGWTNAVTGSGGVTLTSGYMQMNTGATAGSTALLRSGVVGFTPGGDTYLAVNFSKRFSVSFAFDGGTYSTDAIRYFQIKAATTIGDLGDKGLGYKIVGTTLYGESYGSERGEVELMTVVNGKNYTMTIENDPVHGEVRWYVDNVLKGTQSAAAKLPSGIVASIQVFLSVDNQGTAAANYYHTSGINIAIEV